MLKKIFNTIETSYEGMNNLKSFIISVYNGDFKNRDAEINKRFQQYETQKPSSSEVSTPKVGVSGFVGSGLKKARKSKSNKTIHSGTHGARHH